MKFIEIIFLNIKDLEYESMSMYRNFLLKNGFWAKKKSNHKIYMKHEPRIGGLYAIIQKKGLNKGVKIIANQKEYFFNNFRDLEEFLIRLQISQSEFSKILKRKLSCKRLRTLDI